MRALTDVDWPGEVRRNPAALDRRRLRRNGAARPTGPDRSRSIVGGHATTPCGADNPKRAQSRPGVVRHAGQTTFPEPRVARPVPSIIRVELGQEQTLSLEALL